MSHRLLQWLRIPRNPLIGSSLLAFCFLAGSIQPVQAEGSINLTNNPTNPGNRPYLEYSTDPTSLNAGVPRRTVIQVYVRAGEELALGSSTVGVGSGTINYRPPSGAPGTCGNVGVIANRAQEVAGPLPATGGYTPCIVVAGAGQTGIWEIDFVSPNPTNPVGNPSNPTAVAANVNWPTPLTTDTYTAAWDVTVRDPTTATRTPIPGRAFANYLALNMGGNGQAFTARLYILTRDGYGYLINNNGIDPFGFIFFANNKGIRAAATGNPIYRSLQLLGTGPTPTGPSSDFSFQSPNSPDGANDFTHKIFFNTPDSTPVTGLPTASSSVTGSTWLLDTPAPPPTPSNLTFTGIEGTAGNAGTSPLGGNFSFNSSAIRSGPFAIKIDVNRDGIYGNANDRIILGTANPGSNTVFWDGRDGNGTIVPAGLVPYGVTVELYAGEVHFPFIDPENNPSGLIVERVRDPGTNPTADRFLVYYDDAYNYTGTNTYDYSICASGETPAPPAGAGVAACEGVPPNPRRTLNGVSSATGAHRWSSDFGNRRVMDTWAFYPSSVLQVPGLVRLNEADLAVVKTADRSTIAAGSTIGYTIVVTNNGPSNVTNAPFSDNVPATLTNVSWSCTASNGSSCGTANGTGNNISVPLNLLNAGTATIRVTAVVNPTATGTITNTAQILRPNDVTDPDDPGRTGAADNSEPEAITIVAPVTNVVGQKSVRFVADNDTSGTVTVNDEVEYTVTYSNTGANVNSDVINFVINDALPSQLSFVAGSAAIVSQTTGNNITLNPNYNGAGVTALTTLVSGTSAGNSSTLRIGDTITIRFRARINNANNGNPIDNQAIAQHTVPGNATVQNVLSDADAAGGTSTAPALNAAFSQVADDGANTGNAASTADDDPTRITVVPAPLSPNVSGTKSIRFLEDRDNTNSVTVGDVVEYLITYTNQTPIGTADATNFVINEPLPPQLTYVAGSAAIVSQTAGNAITLNSAYNGTGALTNSGTLRLEDTIVIRVRATINSANNGNAISNQATATFNSAANATTRTVLTDADSAGGTSNTPAVNNPFLQTADDGVNTGNNPANTADDDPTLFRVVTPATAPSVVGRKSVRFVADNDTSGTVTLGDTVEYSITYNNLAPAATADALNFVINETLPAQLTYLANSATITNLTTGNTIALVSGYNGSGALTSSGTLRLNDTITITLRATINSINAGNPIPNQATATFSSASNPATQTVLTDADAAGGSSNAPAVNSAFLQTNDDGANTGNNPANTADDDPTLIRAVAGPTANLRLVKRITRLNATAFTEVLDDPSDPNDDAIRNWPAGYLQGRINRGVGTDVVSPFPGDELEYTIYFLSDGTRDISNLNLCDLVPLNTTLVANAFNGLPVAPGGIGGDRGVAIDLNGSTLGYSNGADGDRASFYQVGTSVPVPSGAAAPAPCQAFNTAANGNGAVVINLPSLPRSTAPGAPTTSYGFVRFRVRVR